MKQELLTDKMMQNVFVFQGEVVRTIQESMTPIKPINDGTKYGAKGAKIRKSISRNTLGFRLRDF